MTDVLFTEPQYAQLKRLDPDTRKKLVGRLFLYVFKGTDQSSIRGWITEDDVEFDFLGWRRELHSNGHLLNSGKLYLYSQVTPTPFRPKDLGLSKQDQNLLLLGLQYRPLTARLRGLYLKGKYHSLDPSSFQSLAADALQSVDFQTYLKKFIHRKMAFIYKSYNLTLDAIQSDLVSWALYGLLRAYPEIASLGHAIAIAKTVAKRRGHNLIAEVTAAKNNELIRHSDGTFERVSVSLSSIQDGTGQFLTADGSFFHRSMLVADIEGRQPDTAVSLDMTNSLRDLCRCPSLQDKHRRMLFLLMGNHDKRFSEFLGQDNSEAVWSLPYPSYFKTVCEYINVSPERATQVLTQLRPRLGH